VPTLLTTAEENYLKAIFKIAERADRSVSTNALAAEMQTAAASVTDMLRRLSEKQLITYEKYRGVLLTPEGTQVATTLIRKHRLWEVFLTDKLGFAWHEVHDLAEQLEHVQGEELVLRLDEFLGFPRYDPHGDPIPDAEGRWTNRQQVPLASLEVQQVGHITGVDDHSSVFLQYLQAQGLTLGVELRLLDRIEYDQSVRVARTDGTQLLLSHKVAQNIFIKKS
jgi:DtxR family transcriptional regulator, Mn-dependent transcriptional regulator